MLKANKGATGKVDNKINSLIQRKWLESLKDRSDLSVTEFEKIYGEQIAKVFRIIDKRAGWWFQISLDPGVIEIQTKPSTIEEYLSQKDFIEQEIFQKAKELGIKPHHREGGGHIHIDLSSFATYLHFRNFLVDLFNHDAIFTSILDNGKSPQATPLSLMPAGFQKALTKVLSEVDSLRNINEQDKMFLLAKKVQEEVYTACLGIATCSHHIKKYQLFNLTRITDEKFPIEEKTIELRGLRPQQSFKEFLLEIAMFENRADYLLDFDQQRIIYTEDNAGTDWWNFQAVARFYSYVVSAGMDWQKYQDFIPEHMRREELPTKAEIPEISR